MWFGTDADATRVLQHIGMVEYQILQRSRINTGDQRYHKAFQSVKCVWNIFNNNKKNASMISYFLHVFCYYIGHQNADAMSIIYCL